MNGLEIDNQKRDIRDEWWDDKTNIAATNCGIGTDKMARQTRVVYFRYQHTNKTKHKPKEHREGTAAVRVLVFLGNRSVPEFRSRLFTSISSLSCKG